MFDFGQVNRILLIHAYIYNICRYIAENEKRNDGKRVDRKRERTWTSYIGFKRQ